MTNSIFKYIVSFIFTVNPTAITTMRVREDPADVDSYIEKAIMYVDGQVDESWVNCFKLDGDTFNMKVYPCLYPSIV